MRFPSSFFFFLGGGGGEVPIFVILPSINEKEISQIKTHHKLDENVLLSVMHPVMGTRKLRHFVKNRRNIRHSITRARIACGTQGI